MSFSGSSGFPETWADQHRAREHRPQCQKDNPAKFHDRTPDGIGGSSRLRLSIRRPAREDDFGKRKNPRLGESAGGGRRTGPADWGKPAGQNRIYASEGVGGEKTAASGG